MADSSLRAALFLDRDGVINEEVGYLHRAEDVILVPGVADGIAAVNARDIPVVVISNQAGLARGLYGEAELAAVERRIAALLAPARIDASYHCPHHPEGTVPELRVECDCRKPKAGLLARAAMELGLDLSRSVLVGDKRTDLEAARAAGCASVLVRTGYGAAVEHELAAAGGTLYDAVFDSLAPAVPWILRRLA